MPKRVVGSIRRVSICANCRCQYVGFNTFGEATEKRHQSSHLSYLLLPYCSRAAAPGSFGGCASARNAGKLGPVEEAARLPAVGKRGKASFMLEEATAGGQNNWNKH